MRGFLQFVREQGVVGLAVGIILGTGVTALVNSIVTDLVNPFLGLLLGAAGNLKEAYVMVGPAKVTWGNFVMTVINFVVIAMVVYFGVKGLGLDKLDKTKDSV